MIDTDDIDPYAEGDYTAKGRLTRPQKRALKKIHDLNIKYPKRWFTLCEVKYVYKKTLDSLVENGYLNTKMSEADAEVQYWQWTGKQI